MEVLKSIVGVPYLFHYLTVSGVLLGAILLFVFGFKSTEEPSFSKTKNDAKSNPKKKKTKEKKSVSSSPKPIVVVAKTKSSKADDKGRKSSALKDTKNVNIDGVKPNQEFLTKERKKKGKENVDVDMDSNDEEGGWERALSRKDRKNKKTQGSNQVGKRNLKELNNSSSAFSKTESENTSNKSLHQEKQQKHKVGEDSGVWQEAKSGKKRRKIQKET